MNPTNVFVGATVFLYFDSNISELQQSSVREHLRFQGATIIEDATLGVRLLRAPFLKVEDQSRKFRPLILEMPEWPDWKRCSSMIRALSQA